MFHWTLLILLAAQCVGPCDIGYRILGGVRAYNRSYPYQLSLEVKQYGSFMHSCGAAIIHKRWALTAAHCVIGRGPRYLRLRAGSICRDEGDIHQVTKVILHQNFNKDTHRFDIALLKVKEPFLRTEGKRVKAIPLATETPAPGSSAMITGWGMVSVNGSGSEVLVKAKVFIMDHIICQFQYPHRVITEDMLCAAAFKTGKDSCQGDSGGPLVVNRTLAGIISWAQGCGAEHKPGVNANVAFLRPWIKRTMRENRKNNTITPRLLFQ